MRVLLDENLPIRLRHLFAEGVEAETVRYREWTSLDNGELLEAAARAFDVFVTMDRGIPHQQNLSDLDIGVLLIEAKSNEYDTLAPLMPQVNHALQDIETGSLVEVGDEP